MIYFSGFESSLISWIFQPEIYETTFSFEFNLKARAHEEKFAYN